MGSEMSGIQFSVSWLVHSRSLSDADPVCRCACARLPDTPHRCNALLAGTRQSGDGPSSRDNGAFLSVLRVNGLSRQSHIAFVTTSQTTQEKSGSASVSTSGRLTCALCRPGILMSFDLTAAITSGWFSSRGASHRVHQYCAMSAVVSAHFR